MNSQNCFKDKENAEDEEYVSVNRHQTLESLRNGGVLCDVRLLVGDQTSFSCHRNVLSAHSHYFNGLFNTCLKEKDQHFVDLTFFDARDVKEVISYMYTGRLSITNDNAISLLEISDYLLVETLKEKISLLIGKNCLTHQSCWFFLRMSQTYNSKELYCISENFICENFIEVSRSEAILEVEPENLEWLVKKERLFTEEALLIDLIYRWFRQKNGTTKTFLRGLLTHVYFHSIPKDTQPKALRNLESTIDLMQGYCEAKTHIGCFTKPSTPANLCIIASVYDQVRVWLPRYDRTINLCTLDRALPSIILFGYEQLYVIGGAINCRQQEGCSTEVLCHVLGKSGQSEARSPMKVGVLQPALCILDQLIYVIGGENKLFQSQKTVQVYDTRTDFWELACELSEVHCAPCVIPHDRCIYVIGGHTGRSKSKQLSPLRTVERYDSQCDQWHYIAPLNKPRIDARGFTSRGKIFVVGGFDFSSAHGNKCESYDLLTNEWTVLSLIDSIPQVYALTKETGNNGRVFLLESLDKQNDCGNVICSFDLASGDIQRSGSIRQHKWGMTSPLLRLLDRKTLALLLKQKIPNKE